MAITHHEEPNMQSYTVIEKATGDEVATVEAASRALAQIRAAHLYGGRPGDYDPQVQS